MTVEDAPPRKKIPQNIESNWIDCAKKTRIQWHNKQEKKMEIMEHDKAKNLDK